MTRGKREQAGSKTNAMRALHGLLARGGAGLLPEPLADLVRGRLAGPAEVAVELEAQEGLVHVGGHRQHHGSDFRIGADICERHNSNLKR